MKNEFLIVIPARYQSTRLPGKPLIKLRGKEMLLRTFERCLKVTTRKNILIATDDKRIEKFCHKHTINVLMTSKNCLTGTDRIAEVSKIIKKKIYINVQGDEPLVDIFDLKNLIKVAKKYPNKVINGYTKILDKKLFLSKNIPKVVFRNDGKLLYQSRSPIPITKKGQFVNAWRQVCIYALPYSSLKVFSSIKKKTPLENIEDCELVRFLELGVDVHMINMSNNSISVDTPSDVIKVNKVLKKN